VFAVERCPPAARVETADGRPAHAVLTRAYRDGSVMVLGLGSEPHGSLRLVRAGKPPVRFALPARGVRVWEGDGSEPYLLRTVGVRCRWRRTVLR
jgi:hypothetical protein